MHKKWLKAKADKYQKSKTLDDAYHNEHSVIIKDDVAAQTTATPTIKTRHEHYSAVKQMQNIYKSWMVETTLHLIDRSL